MVFHNFEFIPSTLKHVLNKHFKHVKILGQFEVNPTKHNDTPSARFRVQLTRKLSQIEIVRTIARHLPMKFKYLFMGNLIKDPRVYTLARSEKDIRKSFSLIAISKN